MGNWLRAGLGSLACAALFLLIGCSSSPPPKAADAEPPKPRQWEYMEVRRAGVSASIDSLGSQGWEVYAVGGDIPFIRSSQETTTNGVKVTQNTIEYSPAVFYLRRPK